MDNLQLVIGLEMHCELKSNAKAFSKGKNSYSDIANINVSPVDMAFPGTLPIVNKKCVANAIKMALILNCDIADEMVFDRKNYYYPDLPKGYQITQCTKPVGINGHIDVEYDGRMIPVTIHDIHMEEDAAALDHLFDTSTIDYNRAGVPLIECVTEPCFYSADEAIAFLEYMRNNYRYAGISDADTKKGQIRCDVNVNLKDKITGKYVTPRVEIKNVNSFANVKDAINYEDCRQRKALRNNDLAELQQETRRFDEEQNVTIRMRSKVDAIDYKYFLDPNILPYPISKEWIEELKREIPILPQERKKIYENEYGLSEYDATVLVKDRAISDFFNELVKLECNPKEASNWVSVNVIAYLNKENIEITEFYLQPLLLKQILDGLNSGLISSKQAKEIFNKALEEKKEPNTYISNDNIQISDMEELNDLIKNILTNSQTQIEAYHNGKTNLFDYFVGQVMKETKGKANPVLTKEILHKELDK